MSPRKKKDPATEAAAVAFAHAKVAANPRGCPETVNPPVPAAPVEPEVPCAIENAPDGAKCVVSRTDEGKAVRLLTPAGVTTLAPDDLCYTLPASAKIRRVSATAYEAYRLGVQEDPLFTASTAREAVRRFLEVVT